MVSSMIDTGDRDSAFSEARRFLEALGGQDQKFVFQWFADADDCSIPPGNAFDTFDNICGRLWNFNDSGCGIFVTINESDGSRKAEDINRVRAVFVDLDGSPLQKFYSEELEKLEAGEAH